VIPQTLYTTTRFGVQGLAPRCYTKVVVRYAPIAPPRATIFAEGHCRWAKGNTMDEEQSTEAERRL
jgi:hypothetical protein